MLIKVFCSYSHRDRDLKDLLEEHLSPLMRADRISVFWSDDELSAGSEFLPEIMEALDDADVVLLLLSSSYCLSDFCWTIEMPRAIERRDLGKAQVVPILLRAMHWNIPPINKLTIVPRDKVAVNSAKNIDEAFAEIVGEIGSVIGDVVKHRAHEDLEEFAKSISNVPVTPSLGAEVFHCIPLVNEIARLRQDGITEFLPDILLEFRGELGERRMADVWVYFNTNVTSRLISGGFTEAALSLVNGYSVSMLPVLSRGIRAVKSAANTLAFLNVPLHEMRTLPEAERNLRISNVRVNAAQLGRIADHPTPIVSFVRVSDTSVSPNPQITVATITGELKFEVASAHPDVDLNHLPQGQSLNAGLLADERSAQLTAILKFSGKIAPYEPGGERTGLMVRFNNIPNGVNLYTTFDQIDSVPTALSAKLMLGDLQGNPLPEKPELAGHVIVGDRSLGIAKLPAVGGTSVATWEVQGGYNDEQQEMLFGVIVAYKSDPLQFLPWLAKVTVNGSHAPLSTVNTASSSGPIPRFYDNSLLVDLFSIVA